MGENFLNQPVRNDMRPYGNIRKLPRTRTGQRVDNTIGCLLDYLYYKEN